MYKKDNESFSINDQGNKIISSGLNVLSTKQTDEHGLLDFNVKFHVF